MSNLKLQIRMTSEYHFSTTSPDFVSELPRDYRGGEGTVVEEVGVLERTAGGKEFWKALQLIEMKDGSEFIRTGYYTETGGWQNKPLMLPPDIMADLTGYAEGKIW